MRTGFYNGSYGKKQMITCPSTLFSEKECVRALCRHDTSIPLSPIYHFPNTTRWIFLVPYKPGYKSTFFHKNTPKSPLVLYSGLWMWVVWLPVATLPKLTATWPLSASLAFRKKACGIGECRKESCWIASHAKCHFVGVVRFIRSLRTHSRTLCGNFMPARCRWPCVQCVAKPRSSHEKLDSKRPATNGRLTRTVLLLPTKETAASVVGEQCSFENKCVSAIFGCFIFLSSFFYLYLGGRPIFPLEL